MIRHRRREATVRRLDDATERSQALGGATTTRGGERHGGTARRQGRADHWRGKRDRAGVRGAVCPRRGERVRRRPRSGRGSRIGAAGRGRGMQGAGPARRYHRRGRQRRDGQALRGRARRGRRPGGGGGPGGRAGARGARVPGTESYRTYTVLDIPMADFRRVIDVNLYGVLFSSRAVARWMIENRRGGSIINLGSIMSRMPSTSAPYSISKAGVWMLTK